MKFLSVLIIFFLYRNWPGRNPLHDALPFGPYVRWFRQRGIVASARYLLAVGIPVVLALMLSFKLGGWLLGLVWLAFALVVLAYSVDVFDEEVAFDDQAAWLREPPTDMDLASVEREQDDFQAETIYVVFQSLYPALFWFLFFGPAGALAYGLSRRYLNELDDRDTELEFVERVMFFMEWPAARVTGLLFALVGHFGRCFEVLLESIADTRSSTDDVLIACAEAAMDPVPTGFETVAAYTTTARASNEALRQLLDRSLFGWLAVAAIAAILGL